MNGLKNKFSDIKFFLCLLILFFSFCLASCGKANSPLYGTWAGNGGDIIILRNDDSCVFKIKGSTAVEGTYNGTYSVLLNTIIFSLPTGNLVYEWDVRDNILYLTWTDEKNVLKGVTLYRVES